MSYLTHESALYFLIRVVLGILFFFQGYDKVFNLKISGVITYFKEESKHKHLPGFILITTAYLTSFIELVCGALLIVGLFQTTALYLLGIDIIIICTAFSVLKPMWDMQLLFPRLILLGILLYLPCNSDTLSLDYLFQSI
jgi:uncharacterized membrane protein YphA (DoxX/SURF4 family)